MVGYSDVAEFAEGSGVGDGQAGVAAGDVRAGHIQRDIGQRGRRVDVHRPGDGDFTASGVVARRGQGRVDDEIPGSHVESVSGDGGVDIDRAVGGGDRVVGAGHGGVQRDVALGRGQRVMAAVRQRSGDAHVRHGGERRASQRGVRDDHGRAGGKRASRQVIGGASQRYAGSAQGTLDNRRSGGGDHARDSQGGILSDGQASRVRHGGSRCRGGLVRSNRQAAGVRDRPKIVGRAVWIAFVPIESQACRCGNVRSSGRYLRLVPYYLRINDESVRIHHVLGGRSECTGQSDRVSGESRRSHGSSVNTQIAGSPYRAICQKIARSREDDVASGQYSGNGRGRILRIRYNVIRDIQRMEPVNGQ